jgi:AsmA protein
MNLYDGSFSGQVRLDARKKLPEYRVIKEFQGVRIGELLTDFNGEDRMSGLLNANVSVTTKGEWLSDLKKNSNGNMMLAFKDGALKGFNIRQLIDQAKAKFKGESGPQAQDQKTNFSSLKLRGVIKKGVFISNDLNLQAPVMRVGGEGQVDLNNNTVNYLLNVKLVGTIEGQEGGTTDELSGLLIPVRIDGPFSDPKIDVQLDEMLKNKAAALKAKLKAELEQQKAELQKKISEEKSKLKKIKNLELKNKKELLESKLKAKVEQEKKKLLNKLFN